ncbi:hypothetical protein [Paenibacillus silviterrae]|uniref:hypothetical protein n=1 Tax=Paenibacillus silviterrae TaxID=3242194 RepID=UPI002543B438|nr:hypothetical protein [Paenibacillus chinjuensis]
MKKSRYFPFERNRYFYGKLLTVRDFESEQKYFNDKRRLLNRLLYGSGVIAGLQVIAVDDKSVSVESGVAVDSLGREVIVASPVTLKLSMMEGFSNNEYAKNVYLCIAYDEKGKEPVHAVTSSSVRQEEVSEYNRVVESYRLFIREDAPEPAQFDWNQFSKESTLIHDDGQVRVVQSVPRYVAEGETFEVELRVEKTLQSSRITFEYEPLRDHFRFLDETEQGKLRFVEPSDSRSGDYTVTFRAVAKGKAGERGELGNKPGSALLMVGDRRIQLTHSFTSQVEIVRDVESRLWDAYINRPLDTVLSSPADPYLVLAKISLLQMGPSYVIERVDPLPFGELVVNSPMLSELVRRRGSIAGSKAFSASAETRQLPPEEKPHFSVDFEEETNRFEFTLGLPQSQSIEEEVATGVTEISLLSQDGKQDSKIPFLRQGKSFFSGEIEHGLGSGPVLITVGVELDKGEGVVSELLGTSECVMYGSQDVFQDSEFEPNLPKLSIGTMVYPQKGTFRIGVKLLPAPEIPSIKLRWWAVRKNTNVGSDSAHEQLDSSEQEAAAGTDS